MEKFKCTYFFIIIMASKTLYQKFEALLVKQNKLQILNQKVHNLKNNIEKSEIALLKEYINSQIKNARIIDIICTNEGDGCGDYNKEYTFTDIEKDFQEDSTLASHLESIKFQYDYCFITQYSSSNGKEWEDYKIISMNDAVKDGGFYKAKTLKEIFSIKSE